MKKCGEKLIFYSERLAGRAVTNAAKRGELPPMRYYACPKCGYWHLSRKNRVAQSLSSWQPAREVPT